MNDWEGRYQRGETGWDRGGASAALTHLLKYLEPGAHIVIPGCGRGHEVVELARQGYRVTAIDVAPSAIAHLQQQLEQADLHAELITGDLFDVRPDQPFDAVYEQTCLCAIAPSQRDAYASWLHQGLSDGGLLFALFMQTGCAGGPPYHCDLLSMRQLFDQSRWHWPDHEPLLVPHKNGRFELAYALRKKVDGNE
ncbi:methyltransferase domain-containing protein [Mariprofundus erugo]|uniref:methyltransferase domain-containing protein n=1 Tax=Mariprofundus erugo TaxID=2528639 RepID=UPI0010FEB24A|nr:methyltransferase domain-containing protein [Mariprofundus erugo]TLS75616.1 methyltransferase domain-containing protein [Mariprofundus erugo]